MTEITRKNIGLREDYVTIINSDKRIKIFVFKKGPNSYVLTYGKKLSTNFFVNMYYFLLKGTCREIVCKSTIVWVFSKKTDINYVTKERVARNYFRLFKASLKN